MVYGNYDPAYIQANCDLCGDKLQKRHEYLPFKIEVTHPIEGQRTSEHEGHVCNDCNELEGEYPFIKLCEVEFHYMGDEPTRLLMIDVLGTHRVDGGYHSIHKYGPGDAPTFLRELGAAILECRSPRGTDYESDRVGELASKHADVIRGL